MVELSEDTRELLAAHKLLHALYCMAQQHEQHWVNPWQDRDASESGAESLQRCDHDPTAQM